MESKSLTSPDDVPSAEKMLEWSDRGEQEYAAFMKSLEGQKIQKPVRIAMTLAYHSAIVGNTFAAFPYWDLEEATRALEKLRKEKGYRFVLCTEQLGRGRPRYGLLEWSREAELIQPNTPTLMASKKDFDLLRDHPRAHTCNPPLHPKRHKRRHQQEGEEKKKHRKNDSDEDLANDNK
jgi:hypothetical protein